MPPFVMARAPYETRFPDSKNSLIFVNNFKWKKISQHYLKVVGS